MKKKKEETKEVRLLREFKEESGWSYLRMAEKIGVNPMTVYNWFRGKKKPSAMARQLIRRFLIENEPKEGI